MPASQRNIAVTKPGASPLPANALKITQKHPRFLGRPSWSNKFWCFLIFSSKFPVTVEVYSASQSINIKKENTGIVEYVSDARPCNCNGSERTSPVWRILQNSIPAKLRPLKSFDPLLSVLGFWTCSVGDVKYILSSSLVKSEELRRLQCTDANHIDLQYWLSIRSCLVIGLIFHPPRFL